jgi:CHASE1-domain containing sensor protein
VYYPVLRVAPQAPNQSVVGFDLGSEAMRREAIEEVFRTGLPTASDPVGLLQDGQRRSGMLLFHPVDAAHGAARGLVLAVVRMGDLLGRPRFDPATSIEIAFLGPTGDRTSLASNIDSSRRQGQQGALSLTTPIFAFGKTFELTVQSADDFERFRPALLGFLVFLAGCALTGAIGSAHCAKFG